MIALWRIWRLLWRARPWAMARGAALTVAVMLAGAALLGLSGWFITASGAAGLAGAGVVFDVFRPSAAVRFLALGRTAARYGERLLTHDATLHALTALRVDLLRRQAGAGLDRMLRLRGGAALNRMTADVDALDGVALRLVLPLLGAVATHLLVFATLRWLVGWPVACWIAGGYLVGGALVMGGTARAGHAPSVAAERAGQALRRATIDLVRARRVLIVHGRMADRAGAALAEDRAARAALARLDRVERASAFALAAVSVLVAAGALVLGGLAVAAGSTGPAFAAMGVFAALALAETLQVLRRGMAELGRMRDAAGRVLEADSAPHPQKASIAARAPARAGAPVLELIDLAYRRPGAVRPVFAGLSLTLAAGETLALAGPSGTGKSTALYCAAGLLAAEAGEVRLDGCPLGEWQEGALRARLGMLPQRAALVAGTIRDNLALAGDDLDDGSLWSALEAAALAGVIRARGGLDSLLGEGGAGLSGGEARRLALARLLLRQPAVLLLDEPTEGLDGATAERVLDGLRAYLPEAAILIASHRAPELARADRVLRLG